MLDTAFPRILGDAGNPNSYDLPARTRVIKNAGSLNIVKNGRPEESLVQQFCQAAQELEAEGAIALVSTCGFLISVQQDIASVVSIPVILSSLSLYPLLSNLFGKRPIGIMTASQSSLGDQVLKAAGITAEDVRIVGFEDVPAFADAILRDKSEQLNSLDEQAIEQAAISKAKALISETPEIKAILLECGNLPPYANAIRNATGLPVFSILDAAKLVSSASLVN
jgi:Asp/Glu/hydantoin racemase